MHAGMKPMLRVSRREGEVENSIVDRKEKAACVVKPGEEK